MIWHRPPRSVTFRTARNMIVHRSPLPNGSVSWTPLFRARASGWLVGSAAIFLFLSTACIDARADAPLAYPGQLKTTYLVTYQSDLCGDHISGSVWRHMLRRFAEECHFSEKADQLFAEVEADVRQKWRGQTFPREHVFESGLTCETIVTSEYAHHLNAVQKQVWSGRMSAIDALRMNCDGSSKSNAR